MELRLYSGFRDPVFLHKSKDEVEKLKRNGIEKKLTDLNWKFHGENYASYELPSFLELSRMLNKLIDMHIYSVQIVGMNHREGRK